MKFQQRSLYILLFMLGSSIFAMETGEIATVNDQEQEKARAEISRHSRMSMHVSYQMLQELIKKDPEKAEAALKDAIGVCRDAVLIDAAERGDHAIMKLVLNAGIDRSVRDIALEYAASNDDSEMMKMLIEAGVTVFAMNQALVVAEENGKTKARDYLLGVVCRSSDGSCETFANISKKLSNGRKVTANSSISSREDRIAMLNQIFAASGVANNGERTKLVEALISKSDRDGELKQAVESGKIDEVSRLLSAGVSKYAKLLALERAAQMGNCDMVNVMLSHGVSDSAKNCALEKAAREGHVPVVKILLEAGVSDIAKNFALEAAVGNGQLPVVQALLEVGISLDRALHGAVIDAAARDDLDIVTVLLKTKRITMHARCEALEAAAENGSRKVLEALLKAGVVREVIYHAIERAEKSRNKAIIPFLESAIKEMRQSLKKS